MGIKRTAWVPGQPITAADLNALMQLQDGCIICNGGVLMDSKGGSGISETSLAEANVAIRMTATGQTELGYVRLKVDRDGTGSDLIVDLMNSGFNPDGTTLGTLLGRRIIPKEFIPDSMGYIVVPFALEGLISGSNYWMICNQGGNAENKIDLIGEAVSDANHPVYTRNGNAGTWLSSKAIHFEAWSWSVDGDVLVGVDGGQYDWLEYSGLDVTRVLSYTPASDGSEGLREILTLTSISGVPKKWKVT